MPQYDTCWYDCEGLCYFEGNCSHKGEDGRCLADDEDLLTYEDYQQMKEIESRRCSEPKTSKVS